MPEDVRFSQVLRDRARPGQSVRDVLTSDRVNDISGAIHALSSGAHLSGNVSTMGRGGIIVRRNFKKGRRAETTPYPFKAFISTKDDGSKVVTFWPGTINGLLPTNYASEFTIAIPGTYFFTADVSLAGSEVTTVAIASAGSAPPAFSVLQNALPTTAKILLAIVSDGRIFQINTKSLSLISKEVFRVEKDVPEPGTLPYDSFWTWMTS